jgi:hypothetical protein
MTMTMMTATPLLIDQIYNLETPAWKLLADLYHAMADMIEVPNSLLPEKLRGKTGRSCAELMAPPKLTPREIAKLEAEEREIEKNLRLESYCADSNAEREIRFHEDELRLYRNQITFANLIGMEFDE